MLVTPPVVGGRGASRQGHDLEPIVCVLWEQVVRRDSLLNEWQQEWRGLERHR